MPGGRGRIDQVAERVVRRLAEAQEEARRQPRRAAGIGLRLAAIGEHGVEHVRAEAGLRAVPAAAVLVAEEAVQPAVAAAALAEIVDQLEMSVSRGEIGAVDDLVELDRDRLGALQPAEAMARRLAAGAVIDDEAHRQILLARRHRRRQRLGAPGRARQHRGGQQMALAEEIAEFRQARIGDEVGALDIDMRDAAPAARRHLVARAHHILAGADLDLLRPTRLGQEVRHVERVAGEGRDRGGDALDRAIPHEVEADGMGRDGARLAVLHPERHALARIGRRQAGIEIRRPGIGVMGAGEAGGIVGAEGIERVFHHVMAGRADHVEKELAGEFRQLEAAADLAAVEHDRGGAGRHRLAPLRQHLALGAEQQQPQAHRAGAVARPVIGGDESGGEPAGVAEEGEIGGEVEGIEIAAPVGEQRVGQAQRIEAHRLRARRQQVADVVGGALRLESGDEDGARARFADLGHRLRRAAEHRTPDRRHVLDVAAGDVERGEIIEVGEPVDAAFGVVDRDFAAAEPLQQRRHGTRRQRVRYRLEEGVAAPAVAEGLNPELHLSA